MSTHRRLVKRAQDIITEYLASQTKDIRDAMEELIGLFDGKEQRDIEKEWPGNDFIAAFALIQTAAHENSVHKGFWSTEAKSNVGEKIALMHSELSEALEAFRDGNPQSEKIGGFTHAEEELADCIIRIMDLSGRMNFRIGDAIVAKMHFNSKRPHMHGRNF